MTRSEVKAELIRLIGTQKPTETYDERQAVQVYGISVPEGVAQSEHLQEVAEELGCEVHIEALLHFNLEDGGLSIGSQRGEYERGDTD